MNYYSKIRQCLVIPYSYAFLGEIHRHLIIYCSVGQQILLG